MFKISAFFILLFILTAPATADNKAIVVDPGHGGYDSGIVLNRLREKDLTLLIAQEMAEAMRKEKKPVMLTRNVDRYLSISDRMSLINKMSPEMLLALHMSNANSFSIYVSRYPEGELPIRERYLLSSRQKGYIEQSRALARAIEEEIKAVFGGMDVFHREMPLPVLNAAGTASIVIEVPSFKYFDYKDSALRGRVVSAIINGVASYGKQ